MLGLDMGMVCKPAATLHPDCQLDAIPGGMAHEFLKTGVEGKDVLIVGDMISSGRRAGCG